MEGIWWSYSCRFLNCSSGMCHIGSSAAWMRLYLFDLLKSSQFNRGTFTLCCHTKVFAGASKHWWLRHLHDLYLAMPCWILLRLRRFEGWIRICIFDTDNWSLCSFWGILNWRVHSDRFLLQDSGDLIWSLCNWLLSLLSLKSRFVLWLQGNGMKIETHNPFGISRQRGWYHHTTATSLFIWT
jgi:hypothetical protein